MRFKLQLDYGRLRLPEYDAKAGGETPKANDDFSQLMGVKRVDLETYVVGYFDDARLGLEQFADAMAKYYQIKLPPRISGYCTWYSDPRGGAGDEKSIVELSRFAAKELKPFGFSFVQIDDRWQDGRAVKGPARGFESVNPRGPYPHGMKPVAEEIQKLGLTAGIWFMPFARNYQDPAYKDRQSWFVKRTDGRPYDTDWGGTSLDLTNPEARKYVAELVKTIHSWGYNYFKMDGLYTGAAVEILKGIHDEYTDDNIGNQAPFHDPSVTNIEAYRSGLKLIRDAVGPGVFFSGCAACQNMRSLGGSIGLVDSMRIGPDNSSRWADYRREIAEFVGGSIVSGPIRGSRLYFLNGRVWWNDPDACYVRNRIPLAHARLITTWAALTGQFFLDSDWIPSLSAERLDVLKRTMLAHSATARPVDLFDSMMPSIWLVTDDKQSVCRNVIGLCNWENSERAFEFAADWAALDQKKTYFAFDFWANKPAGTFTDNKFKFDVPGQSCRAIAVRAAEGRPVLVSTSHHVTQGIVDMTGETWNANLKILSGTSQVVGSDAYELRIAGMGDGGTWSLAGVSISDADRASGTTIVAKPVAENERGWIRVVITTKNSRVVQWNILFTSSSPAK